MNGAEVAESNVASCLIRLGRFQEAFDRMQTLLPRLDAANVGNQAYTRLYLTESLIALGRLDEARAGAAQALAYCRKAGAARIANLMALLVARQGRQRSAARLLGHARHCYAAMGVRMEKGDLVLFERAETIVGAALDAASVQHLMHEGEGLDSAAADALLFADHDGA